MNLKVYYSKSKIFYMKAIEIYLLYIFIYIYIYIYIYQIQLRGFRTRALGTLFHKMNNDLMTIDNEWI